MITYRKKFIHIIEAWDGEEPPAAGVDLLRLYQRPRPARDMFCRAFYTILIDLHKEPELLLAGMKKDTRYEIRRAGAKDNLVYEHWDARQRAPFNEFCAYYDQFAAQKGQPALDRRWLALLAGAGALLVSRVRAAAADTCVWHAYHLCGYRATLLYSASLFRQGRSSADRNRAGRANRFHHWQDMLLLRAAGTSVYDFGGWYQGHSDAERLRINKFKEEFGGEIVKNFICERGLTLKGRRFLRLRQRLLGNAI